jgi:ferredoxin
MWGFEPSPPHVGATIRRERKRPAAAAGKLKRFLLTPICRVETRGAFPREPRHSRIGESIMALKIIASQCTVCGACEFDCPTAAIRMKGDTYIIDPKKCTECDGETPHCAEVCPVPDTCVPA